MSTSTAAPISVAPSQAWDGNDGSWSTFIVRVGTPPQDFRVLISTAGQETWVPVPDGCTSDDPSDCATTRGVLPFNGDYTNGFLKNESSTWNEINIFNLDLETALGYGGNGDYGFDTIGLQIENSGGPTLDHQVVAGIADKDFYLGIFGLGPKPANFSNYNDPQPAFLPTLKNNSLIPSLSYGYTAGAPYRYQKVLGSLTLGGYDASRFNSTPYTLPFGSDDSRSLVVGVHSISTTTLQGDVTLMSSGSSVVALIDSTVPHLWLPRAACDNFAQTFNLTYDNITDLYLVGDDVHTSLVNSNPSITLALSAGSGSSNTFNIELPYAAFDLEASYPFYLNATRYFPIRRAANDTQYTLGRTFLQEAYLTVDYERSQFTVAQAAFSDPMPTTNIVTIEAASNGTSTNNSSNGLSGGAIAGIVIGALAGVAIIGALIWFLLRRRKRRPQYAPVELSAADSSHHQGPPSQTEFAKVQQLEDSSRQELPTPREKPPELDAGNVPHYFGGGSGPGTPRSELPSPPLMSRAPTELPTHVTSTRHELPT